MGAVGWGGRDCIFNLLIVFAVSGLWHGANWTFVIWGLLHGLYIILWRQLSPAGARLARLVGLDRRPGVLRALQVSVTFVLVCFAWIFFRANTVRDAWFIVTHMWGGLDTLGGLNLPKLAPGLLGLAVVLLGEILEQREPVRRRLSALPGAPRWAVYYALTLAIIFWGTFGEEQFIYFQF